MIIWPKIVQNQQSKMNKTSDEAWEKKTSIFAQRPNVKYFFQPSSKMLASMFVHFDNHQNALLKLNNHFTRRSIAYILKGERVKCLEAIMTIRLACNWANNINLVVTNMIVWKICWRELRQFFLFELGWINFVNRK